MSCGCNSSSSDCGSADCADFPSLTMPPVSCGTNIQVGSLKRYAMVEVKTNGASTNSANPSGGTSGGTTSLPAYCPASSAPFYSYTIDDVVTLPAVGGFFQIKVCNHTQWKAGMWVAHALGNFPITSIDTTTGTLTLRNSCIDNSAIPNNGDPGDTYNGPSVIYPTDDACSRYEQIVTNVTEIIQEAEELCFPNIPDLAGSERMNILGGLAECVDACTGQTQPGTRCGRFAPEVFVDSETIQLPAAPELTLGSRTSNGLTAPMQLMAWDPVNGRQVRVDIPANGDYLLNVTSGVMTLAQQQADQLIYTSPKTVASGAGSGTRNLNDLSGVTVPSWATHAIVECRASIYSLGAQKLGNNTSNASVSVNNRNVAKVSSTSPWGSQVYTMDPNSCDTNTTYAKLSGTSIDWSIAQNADTGREPIFECYVKLVGFVKAQIEP